MSLKHSCHAAGTQCSKEWPYAHAYTCPYSNTDTTRHNVHNVQFAYILHVSPGTAQECPLPCAAIVCLVGSASPQSHITCHHITFTAFLQYSLKIGKVPEVRPWLPGGPWEQAACPELQVLCCSTGRRGKHWGGLDPDIPTRRSGDSNLGSGVVPRTSKVAMRLAHWHCNQGW